MEKNGDAHMSFVAVRIDETIGCRADFLERCGGKLWGVYIYDESERTFCCEITPSYWLELVDYLPASFPEGEEESEALSLELLEVLNESERGMYMHVHAVEKLGGKERFFIPNEDEHESAMDDALEAYRANPIW